MGIMLGGNDGLIIRNCYFRNQPDSGSADEGGIDFENRGCGCLIDHCTFAGRSGHRDPHRPSDGPAFRPRPERQPGEGQRPRSHLGTA